MARPPTQATPAGGVLCRLSPDCSPELRLVCSRLRARNKTTINIRPLGREDWYSLLVPCAPQGAHVSPRV
eukprot:3456754-Prymnesium_polylepis.1